MGRQETDTRQRHPLADIDQIVHAPARLMVLTYLYVVESADYVFLTHLTGLTWGNLSTHMRKLEDAGYVTMIKEFKDRKPHSMISLTDEGRQAFKDYRLKMQMVLNELPD